MNRDEKKKLTKWRGRQGTKKNNKIIKLVGDKLNAGDYVLWIRNYPRCFCYRLNILHLSNFHLSPWSLSSSLSFIFCFHLLSKKNPCLFGAAMNTTVPNLFPRSLYMFLFLWFCYNISFGAWFIALNLFFQWIRTDHCCVCVFSSVSTFSIKRKC